MLSVIVLVGLSLNSSARADDPSSWQTTLSGIAIQDGGRTMPLEAYARRLAADVTGREHWSASRGPSAYAGRAPVALLCDLAFKGDQMTTADLIGLENKPFKVRVGLDPEKKFFSAREIAACKGINDLLDAYDEARRANPDASASRDQRLAMDLFASANRIAGLATGEPLPIVPGGPNGAFRAVGLTWADAGTGAVREAWTGLRDAYVNGGDLDAAAARLKASIAEAGTLSAAEATRVRQELFYVTHNPWRKTQIAYGLAVVLFGLSRLMLRKPLVIAAVAATAWGLVEHILGTALRVMILERAPVTNTFESLLWMGIVAIAIGAGAQAVNRKGYYLFGGVCAALLSVLFAGLVPLTDRTNSLPAVLRSNYWLIVHVLTIVASYGILAVSAVLGHVYLVREVLLKKVPSRPTGPGFGVSHTLVVQMYRTIQIGLLLLTAGTILGGVWAADSWGRFWGWDPKETWALISIIVYFAVLHARYVRWLKDFGLAASAILGFVVIVWTFYGVNYVMATGLHSYGFGSGGEVWVGLWALSEIVFLIVCRLKYVSGLRGASGTVVPS